MIKYIVLLRGVNVGGHKKVPMAELRELLTKSGFKDVKTYIQSGNIMLQTILSDHEDVANKIQKAIQEQFGFKVPVIVKTITELKTIFEACPFSQAKKEQSYFVLLSSIPKPEMRDRASEKIYDNEEYQIINDCLYFHSSEGYGKSKFSLYFFERKLKVYATARNFRTMAKLLELSTS